MLSSVVLLDLPMCNPVTEVIINKLLFIIKLLILSLLNY